MPELERWVLHRLAELDAQIRAAVETHDWTGVYPALHSFCATDLSAFYFDIRKDALYCDRPDSLRRRAARTVLDHLHRCLTTWLAPVLVFTAEEAWVARFGETGQRASAGLSPTSRRAGATRGWRRSGREIREIRRVITGALEAARADGTIGASLQAAPVLSCPSRRPIAVGRRVGRAGHRLRPSHLARSADGRERRWPMLARRPGKNARAAGACCRRLETTHPALCLRCTDARSASGLVCQPAS